MDFISSFSFSTLACFHSFYLATAETARFSIMAKSISFYSILLL